jgi:hypothetical protein
MDAIIVPALLLTSAGFLMLVDFRARMLTGKTSRTAVSVTSGGGGPSQRRDDSFQGCYRAAGNGSGDRGRTALADPNGR